MIGVPRRLSAALALAVLCAACGDASRDSAASTGSAPPRAGDAPPRAGQRIVSLAPSTTETLFAIGAGARVVGVSRFCDYPAETARLPRVGGYNDPSLEAVLALRPTLVTGARGPGNRGAVDRLGAQQIDTFFPADGSLDEVRAAIRGLGQRTQHARESGALVAAIDRHLAAIGAAIAGRPRPRVLLVFGRRPLSVAGPHTFPDEMLRVAGADNVVTDGPTYPSLGIERVIELAPDLILEAGMVAGGDGDFDWARYPSIPAVRDGRVIRFEDARVLRPGPRVAEGVAVLARLVHPGVAIP